LSYRQERSRRGLLILTFPMWLIPDVFSMTAYMQFVYIPLHIFLCLLCW
jgi:hypothetical protein